MFRVLIFFNSVQYYVVLLGIKYGEQFSEPDCFQGTFDQEIPKFLLTIKFIIILIKLKTLICVCMCVFHG